MQQEMVLRLINNNKINGYLLILSGDNNGIYYCKELKSYKPVGDLFDNWKHIDESFKNVIIYPFEQGINVDGKWFFEGDIFELEGRTEKVYTLYYKSISIDEICAFDFVYWQLRGKFDELDLCWGLIQCKGKRIGSIYGK